jgi:hypothetical protein
MCLNSSRNLLYVRRPRPIKDCRATGGGGGISCGTVTVSSNIIRIKQMLDMTFVFVGPITCIIYLLVLFVELGVSKPTGNTGSHRLRIINDVLGNRKWKLTRQSHSVNACMDHRFAYYSKSSFIRHAWGMMCADRSNLPLQRTVTYDTQF